MNNLDCEENDLNKNPCNKNNNKKRWQLSQKKLNNNHVSLHWLELKH